jgi:LacI family transcriptional regulator
METQISHLTWLSSVEAVRGVILAPTEGLVTSNLQKAFYDAIDSLLRSGKGLPTIKLRNEEAAFEATNELIAAGHTKIGISIAEIPSITQRDRLAGYQAALEKAGLKYEERLVISDNEDISPSGGLESKTREQVKRLINEDHISAIFCATAYTTIEATRAIADLNLRIPADISVVGWDQVFETDIIRPAITRIAFDMKDYPKEAFKILSLSQRQDDGNVPEAIYLQTELRDRGSSVQPWSVSLV